MAKSRPLSVEHHGCTWLSLGRDPATGRPIWPIEELFARYNFTDSEKDWLRQNVGDTHIEGMAKLPPSFIDRTFKKESR